eukprot:CAMPEP_0117763380 /NCGR_PEP_ID=MMETSP0947-20121206/18606_1 /TAXON_ID=44440 /ORGANISM="Chattonella subsalsa, Strain CCMP2191" /LENGTH=365 /DNA_ID=CAMNT_0005585081 /DNA_START=54 /DNA_END=1148 /DNA_ORIENTATION=-
MRLFSRLNRGRRKKDDASTGSAGTFDTGRSSRNDSESDAYEGSDNESNQTATGGMQNSSAIPPPRDSKVLDDSQRPSASVKPPQQAAAQAALNQVNAAAGGQAAPASPEMEESSFMGEIMEEVVDADGVTQYRVHWKDTQENIDDWIEDYVLRAEFPGAIEQWQAKRAQQGLPPPHQGPPPHQMRERLSRGGSRAGSFSRRSRGGAGPSEDELILERLMALQLKMAMACLTDTDHMVRAQNGVLEALKVGDMGALRLVLEVLDVGRPDSRWLDGEMDDIKAIEIDLKREASRGPESRRVADLRDELERVERGIDGLSRDIRQLEDALSARRSEATLPQKNRAPPGGASPLPELPDELNQTVEVNW